MEDFTETVYEHVHGSDTFTVTACEPWSKTMINNLKKQYPSRVDIVHTNDDGSMVAHIPAEWMTIKPKHTKNLTEEQRKVIGDRLRSSRSTNNI